MIIKDFRFLQQFIADKFMWVIHDGVSEFINRNGDKIAELQDSRMHSICFDTNGCKLMDCFVKLQPNGDFYVVCKVGVCVELLGNSLSVMEWDVMLHEFKNINLKVVLKAEFNETMENVLIEDISVIRKGERFASNGIDSRKFIPRMRKNMLDDVATEFLLKYYPQALDAPTRLPVKTVLRQMGLTVRASDLEYGKFGKCYFEAGINIRADGEEERVPRKTVLYREAKGNTARKSANFTLMHEGAHWYCNKDYFARMSIIDPSLVVANFTDATYTGDYAEDFQIMEWQANALAPRILMPAETTRQKFNELADEIRESGEKNPIRVYEKAIRGLSDFFDVSITTAKIRIIELGYTGLKGIFDYVDGAYTRPYLYDTRKTKRNETYSIGQIEFIKLAYENEKIKELLVTRKFLYVEHFFVLNDRKYIRQKANGQFVLTDYAFMNMDKCCLAFTCEKDEGTQQQMYSCCLSRDQSQERHKRFYCTIDNNLALLDTEVDAVVELQEQEDALKLVMSLNGRVGDDIARIQEIHGCSDRQLEEITHLHRHRISAIKRNEKMATKKEILAICAGLELHPRVTHHLLSKIGCNLTTSYEEDDMCYEYLINAYFDKGIEAWNFFLESANRVDWQIPYRIV